MRRKCHEPLSEQKEKSGGGKTWSSIELLEDLLLRTKRCQATDPRDKIFGLLGTLERLCLLSGFEKRSLCPDYRLTAPQLYQEVTMLMIKETGSPRILSLVRYTICEYENTN